jgi:hypothetical protein
VPTFGTSPVRIEVVVPLPAVVRVEPVDDVVGARLVVVLERAFSVPDEEPQAARRRPAPATPRTRRERAGCDRCRVVIPASFPGRDPGKRESGFPVPPSWDARSTTARGRAR